MVIRNHYHEVLTFAERLMIFIIRALQTKEEYKRLTKVVEQVFPGAGNFKLPPGDDALRITFAEGIKMLKEAGVEADEMADLRYGSLNSYSDYNVPYPFHPWPLLPSSLPFWYFLIVSIHSSTILLYNFCSLYLPSHLSSPAPHL
jgi:hypothetical protein